MGLRLEVGLGLDPSVRTVTPSCGKSWLSVRCHLCSSVPSLDRTSWVQLGVRMLIVPPPAWLSATRT